ncbi:Mitochondrial ribosome small subunit biogenesis protein [Recurvomyces mirabilis]|nr:Mitochondrial ribosome small subunit biogenesis protein [Recurvomyces mirabilis]
MELDTSIGTGLEAAPQTPSDGSKPQICDRCHDLLYHSRGTSILHPSMQSIQSIIEESPHKHNHIYHILDAADFPMSLIPNLQYALDLPRLRTKNRRSKSTRYSHGRVAEVSFIITRSDLLAPKKEQVDTLMPYLQGVLRDALGRSGRNIRLGNVRCVSAKRGWWTKQVKEEIYERGGAGWMVGKANVGKSALVEVVFPKARGAHAAVASKGSQKEKETELKESISDEAQENIDAINDALTADGSGEQAGEEPAENGIDQRSPGSASSTYKPLPEEPQDDDEEFDLNDNDSLLPPPQRETPYPHMPLVSSLPGTTASPIRLPFGTGKGELIDLPGIDRCALITHIEPEHHKEMVMKHRITPDQIVIRPGQSLLLGGFIRITPELPDNVVMLAYPFVPAAFTPHVTGTHKAIAIQTGIHSEQSFGREGQVYEGNVSTIATQEAKAIMKQAGRYELEWDVTKRRAGPLTDRTAGWVELVCQVRKRAGEVTPGPSDALGPLDAESEQGDSTFLGGLEAGMYPRVEVFSPDGAFVGVRRPMGAAMLNEKKVAIHARKGRPRMSIGMVKRRRGGGVVEA